MGERKSWFWVTIMTERTPQFWTAVAAIGTFASGAAAALALFLTSGEPKPEQPPVSDAKELHAEPEPIGESKTETAPAVPKEGTASPKSGPSSAKPNPQERDTAATAGDDAREARAEIVGSGASAGAIHMRALGLPPVRLEPTPAVPGRFRIMFRLLANAEAEIPITAVSSPRAHILDWTAFTSKGASCYVHFDHLNGVDIFSDYNMFDKLPGVLDEKANPHSAISKTRAMIVIADFYCDGRVSKGDTTTLQIKFYLKAGDNWGAADYTFEGLTVGSET